MQTNLNGADTKKLVHACDHPAIKNVISFFRKTRIVVMTAESPFREDAITILTKRDELVDELSKLFRLRGCEVSMTYQS